MLMAYAATPNGLERLQVAADAPLSERAVWADLLHPSQSEDKTVEAAFGIAIPTREEMREIEISSRLYVEEGARYMTASLLCHADTEQPILTEVSFILTGSRLVTVRYDEPKPFALFSARACRVSDGPTTGEAVLLGLLDAIIDRTADILERNGAEIDQISSRVFERDGARATQKRRYQNVLKAIGRKGDLLSKARESLMTISRLLLFMSSEAGERKVAKETRSQLRSMIRDVQSLTDHAAFQVNKVTFLLDATLGMVSIEQNDIIKLFSVVAVVFLPPTLVASIYGMNFDVMPELHWQLGYPLALAVMLVSAILPYVFFKLKRWL